ncbi:MAG: hypothetical protein HC898_07470 [Phycisphaerales bacterium]|nr:hypothetical protein [Phycisphaerales bacterium]
MSIDVRDTHDATLGPISVPQGQLWSEMVAGVPAADLAEPESGLEATEGRKVGA